MVVAFGLSNTSYRFDFFSSIVQEFPASTVDSQSQSKNKFNSLIWEVQVGPFQTAYTQNELANSTVAVQNSIQLNCHYIHYTA